MNPETLRILDSIARDRNIDRELLLLDLEAAMVSALRKHFNSLDTEEFGCEVDRITGKISLWRNDPETGAREEIPLSSLGRIPAQTAKQVMIQKFREDERNSLLEEFGRRQGELVTGTGQRYEGGALIVQIDRAEGFMPRSEQIPGEQFQPGDRVRCLILDVRDATNQVKIVLSRSHPDFIRKLFEAEVPEVAEHVIEIKAMSREPGFRTKLAVASVDTKVDPVGACVGVRGSRIRNIVDELGGEKIDIVRWNESSQVLIANALKPAEVEEVSLCFELGRATIIVREDQLSLAIGRNGQNVRLASELTGWKIDLYSSREWLERGGEGPLFAPLPPEDEAVMQLPLTELKGLSPELVAILNGAGYQTLNDVLDLEREDIEKIPGMTTERSDQLVAFLSELTEDGGDDAAR